MGYVVGCVGVEAVAAYELETADEQVVAVRALLAPVAVIVAHRLPAWSFGTGRRFVQLNTRKFK